MERPWMSRVAGTIRRFCTSARVRTWLAGALCGLYLLVWCHAYLGRWGMSLPAVAGLATGLTLGVEVAWRRAQRRRAGNSAGTPFLLHLGLASWTVALPWLISGWSAVIGRVPVDTLATPAMMWSVMLAGGIVLLAVPAALLAGLGWIAAGADANGHRPGSERLAQWLAGAASGLAFGALFLAPGWGLQMVASLLAVVGAAVAFTYLMRRTGTEPDVRPVAGPHGSVDSARGRMSRALWSGLACCAAGAFCAGGQRLAHQLMPAAAYTIVIQWAALLLGAAWGMKTARRRLAAGSSYRQIEAAACWWGAAVFAIVPLGFPLLIDGMLLLNAHVASVWVLMAGRSLVAGLLVLPAGVCAGVLLSRMSGGYDGRGDDGPLPNANPWNAPFGAFALGLLAAHLLIRGGVFAGAVITIASIALALLGSIRGAADLVARRAWRPRVATAGACALPVLVLFVHDPGSSARAARLLFSTTVFMAKQAGLNPDLLTATDDARLVDMREGQHGTYTLWKVRGVQYQLRDGGIPKSVVSGDARTCPQYPPEIVQAVLPLVLHDRPARVLLLGLGGGTPLATILRFPVLEVTYAEDDPALLHLLRQHVWNGRANRPFDDPRVQALQLDPPLAVAGRQAAYDVIISNADQSALLPAAASFTAEFYANAARQLAPDGIFCQRFQALDFGAMPLAVMARTLRTAFQTVAFVEAGSGEYILLGTNSPHGLVRDQLVERLQAPQVGSVLAEAGWDWSILLNLNTYADAGLGEFASGQGASVNTAANAALAYRLPPEIIRWAPKQQEVQAELGPRATRFLAWKNVDGEDPDILRRLAEVSGQRNIITGSPDQYWAYRKTVREQITERPRSLIVPVKGDVMQSVHPIDQRRLDYFAALGDALKHRPPRPDDIRHVAEFARPFDPLLSYFLHQEVAELYARLPARDFEAELPHRLHAIYFADGQDRSVRNVAAALELLSDQPEAVPDVIARWDHLNGLLQMMQLRWQNRGVVPPKSSRIVLNDIERSIAGVEAAFEALDEISREHTIPHAEWPTRRKYLERTLLRPLRTYRSQVLPHHLKRQRLAERTGEDVDATNVRASAN